MSTALRDSLVTLRKFSGLSSRVILTTILKLLPNVFKYMAVVLLLLNVRSLPLVWHCA